MFAEARAVRRQNLRGHFQRHASKGQESDFGHCPSCSIRKHRKPLLVDPRNKNCVGDVNRAINTYEKPGEGGLIGAACTRPSPRRATPLLVCLILSANARTPTSPAHSQKFLLHVS